MEVNLFDATIEQLPFNAKAIARGLEQYGIEQLGGAKDSRNRNAMNGISPQNENRYKYEKAAFEKLQKEGAVSGEYKKGALLKVCE